MRVLRLPEVVKRTGLSRATIYRLMKDGQFPKSFSLSANAIGFVEDEIDAHNAKLAAARAQAEE